MLPGETEISNWQTKIVTAWMKTWDKKELKPTSLKTFNFYYFSLEAVKSILSQIMQLSTGL